MGQANDFWISRGNTVSLAERLAGSGAFKALFREGMTLVEETATYLDGPGRDEARELARAPALACAAESMRLTTRLMQLASWLLLQRAVNEGEMTQAQATAEKRKVRLSNQDIASSPSLFLQLPQKLQDLTTQSLRLQTRIFHLDRMMSSPAQEGAVANGLTPALEASFAALRDAFPATA